MSLGARVGLALGLLVAITLALSWVVVNRAVLRPFNQEMRQAFLDETIYVAHEVVEGADLEALADDLGLVLELHDVERPPITQADWNRTQYRGRRLFVRRSDEVAAAFVRTPNGWLKVSRELDLSKPRTLVARWLLVVGLLVGLVAVTLTRMAGRPLKEAADAMTRMAGGDLRHRLHVTGPPELRAAAGSFNAMADRVEAMLRAERQLLAGLSHELRTPLTRLRLELELLREGLMTDQRLAAMEGDLAEVDDLVGEMLEISRLELGDRTLDLEDVALSDLAAEAIALADLSEHTTVIAGQGTTVAADRILVVRVLKNLLQNAGKYAPEGSTVTMMLDGTSVEVQDEGPGVPEDALERLFDPFYRVDESRTRKSGGLGLGLMIARQIIELHGGRITARNLTGGGLAVRLTLPGG